MIVNLLLEKNVFPASEWRDFLKNYNINWHKTKHNEKANSWNPIEKKGFVIWVSWAHIWHHENSWYWRVILELANKKSEDGIKLLKSIQSEAIHAFDFRESI